MQICESINGPKSFNIRGYTQKDLFNNNLIASCSCKAYEFTKVRPRTCKHIKYAYADTCGWRDDITHVSQTQAGICPQCEGPTVMLPDKPDAA